MTSRLMVLFCALLLILPLLLLTAQEVRIHTSPYHSVPAGAIRVDTNLVELAVTVRDAKGAAVGGFQAADFALTDEGKPQTIKFFSEQKAGRALTQAGQAASRSVALFFDDVHSGAAGFDRSRKGAEKLIGEALPPGVRMGIFTASGEGTLEFSSDAKALRDAIAAMRRHPDTRIERGFGVCPTLTAYQAYVIAKHLDLGAVDVAAADIKACSPEIPMETARSQAQTAGENGWNAMRFQSTDGLKALVAVVRHLATADGTRVLVIVSPGFATGGMEQEMGAITDACLRAQIVVNALDDEGLMGSGGESPESLGPQNGVRAGWAQRTMMTRNQIVTALMADTAAATGGKFVMNINDIGSALETLVAEPEVSYLVGFNPTSASDDKYHALKMMVVKPGKYTIAARAGYFAGVKTAAAEGAAPPIQDRIDRIVSSAETLDQIPVSAKLHVDAAEGGKYRIRLSLTVDARKLRFANRDGKSIQQLTFVTVLEDANGVLIEGKQSMMDLALTEKTRASMEATGIKAEISFVAPQATYRIREVVREAVGDQFAAFTSNFRIK